MAASPPTNVDRFLDHLRTVPELAPAIAECERRRGVAHPFRVCDRAADLVITAYREGDPDRALRIVTVLTPAVDEDSPMYSPNCVQIAFLERDDWDDAAVQEHLDEWPAAIRAILKEQLAYVAQSKTRDAPRHAEWQDLFRTGRGQPVEVVLRRLRAIGRDSFGDFDAARRDFHRATTARIISDPHWLYHHPVESVLLAWRGRRFRRPWRTLSWLRRPRFVG